MTNKEKNILRKDYFSDREALEAMFSVVINYRRFHVYSFTDGARVNIDDDNSKPLGTEYVLSYHSKDVYRWRKVEERICGACGEETRLEPKSTMRTYKPYSKELDMEIEVTVLCESVWCPLCTQGYFVGNQQDELVDRINQAVKDKVKELRRKDGNE